MELSKGTKGAREDGFSYGEVENLIASVLGVKAEARPRITARIRHLRNIGVLSIPRPGSGVKILYSEKQAFELLIALALQSVGETPTRAGSLAKKTVEMVFEQGKTQPLRAVVWVAPDEEQGGFSGGYRSSLLMGDDRLNLSGAETGPIFSVIDVGRFWELLQEAIAAL